MKQPAHGRLRPFDEFVAGACGGERAVTVGVVAAALPGGGGVDRGVDDLGSGRAVEAGPTIGQSGEAMSQVEHDGARYSLVQADQRPASSASASCAARTINSLNVMFGSIVSGWAYPWRTIS